MTTTQIRNVEVDVDKNKRSVIRCAFYSSFLAYYKSYDEEAKIAIFVFF